MYKGLFYNENGSMLCYEETVVLKENYFKSTLNFGHDEQMCLLCDLVKFLLQQKILSLNHSQNHIGK
jgi:hypothetical protein